MKVIYPALLAGFFALTCSAAPRDVLERAFEVGPGGTLRIQLDRGAIHVKTAESDRVEVTIVRELKRGSEAQGREAFEAHKVELRQDGNTVSVHTETARHFRLFRRNPANRLQVECTVTIPKRFNVNLGTAGGNIEIASLEGTVEASTAGGSIHLLGARGDVHLQTSGGNLHAGRVEGSLRAQTSGGSIVVDSAAGAVEAETSGGNIEILDAQSTVSARTAGGNLSARWTRQPKGNSVLRTSGGNVTATLGDGVGAAIAARTSGGNIHSDFPGQANRDRSQLTAQANGGGPDLLLETSGGNITIRRR